MRTTAFGQRAIEEATVKKVAWQRGATAAVIAFGLSIPVGVLVMGLTVPGAAITGFYWAAVRSSARLPHRRLRPAAVHEPLEEGTARGQ
jgi:hypothetical protein